MPTIFSETLTRLRKEAGFPTAYKFYHANGGAPMLKLSYRKYLVIEQGLNLPVFGRLRSLILGLHIIPGSSLAKELVTAWLRTMAGEEPFHDILEPILAVQPEPAKVPATQKALKKELSGNIFYLNTKQLAALSDSFANYICSLGLTNDTGAWTAERLSVSLGLSKKETERSLAALESVKLLKKVKGGRYKCPLAGKSLEYPHLNEHVQGMLATIMKYQEELVKAGAHAWLRRGIIRADSDALRDFFPLMGDSISASAAYSVSERTKKSAIYFVEGRIVKLRDF